jgi:D-serine dehydratase
MRVKKVEKSIGILGTNLKLKTLEIQWDQSDAEKWKEKPLRREAGVNVVSGEGG